MLKTKATILCLLIIACSCIGVRAPKESLPKRKAIVTDTFGGWIIINPGSTEARTGELIAHTEETVWIMTGGGLEEIAKSQIVSARLIMYNTHALEASLWTTFGSIATLSNGFFLAFTFPMWLVSGIPVSNAESRRENYIDYPGKSWDELGKFARFPQGMPRGIELSSLLPR